MADGRRPDMSPVNILKATQQCTEPYYAKADRGAYWRHLVNMIELSMCDADVAFCQIILTFSATSEEFCRL